MAAATGPTITAATSGTAGHQGDQWRAAGRWYLVADEGGGLLPGMIRAHCGEIVARSGIKQGRERVRGSAAYLLRAAGATEKAEARQCGGVLSRLFMGTLVAVLKNNTLFIR